jgi:hypothetical protein
MIVSQTGRDEVVWGELQKQLDAKGLKVKRGTIQDATFIKADPGKRNGVGAPVQQATGHPRSRRMKMQPRSSDINPC